MTCPRACLTQTQDHRYAASFQLLRKLELKQQSPALSKALAMMAEPPEPTAELPEEPTQPVTEASQALVTTVSDATYNERLQDIMQHLASQEEAYDAEEKEGVAEIKHMLCGGEDRPCALYMLLRWSCAADDDDALARMALEAGANPNSGPQRCATPLYMACLHDCPRVAKQLLAAQANPNKMIPFATRGEGRVSETAVVAAIKSASPEMIQVLLEASADFSAVKIYDGVTHDAMQVHRTQPAPTRPWPSQQRDSVPNVW